MTEQFGSVMSNALTPWLTELATAMYKKERSARN